jgi:hypothetical protein
MSYSDKKLLNEFYFDKENNPRITKKRNEEKANFTFKVRL